MDKDFRFLEMPEEFNSMEMGLIRGGDCTHCTHCSGSSSNDQTGKPGQLQPPVC